MLKIFLFTFSDQEYSIFDLANVAGCSIFVKALFTQGLLNDFTASTDKRLTLFCPSDKSYQNYLRNRYARLVDRDVMLYHVASKDWSKSRHSNNQIFVSRLHGAVLRTTPSKIVGNRVVRKINLFRIII